MYVLWCHIKCLYDFFYYYYSVVFFTHYMRIDVDLSHHEVLLKNTKFYFSWNVYNLHKGQLHLWAHFKHKTQARVFKMAFLDTLSNLSL